MATKARKLSPETEFDGDQCVVLPAGYLKSANAVSEIYDEQLAKAAVNFEVDGWTRPRFLRGMFLAALVWAVPSIWTVCL
jgi:hypothetical protein